MVMMSDDDDDDERNLLLLLLTSITFFVVSFSDRAMSSSRSSCGFRSSSLFFSNLARLPTARFFCSTASGPSLSESRPCASTEKKNPRD